MGDRSQLGLRALNTIAGGIAAGMQAWGASQENRREWEFEEAIRMAQGGFQDIQHLIQSTGDYTQHPTLFAEGGFTEDGQQIVGANQLLPSIIEKFGSDPYVATELEKAWPQLMGTAERAIQDYSFRQEMIFQSARYKESLDELWRNTGVGDYNSQVGWGEGLIERAVSTGVWSPEEAIIERQSFMAAGVERMKADIATLEQIPNIDDRIDAIDTIIDGGIAAGFFSTDAAGETMRETLVYSARFDHLKTDLLAQVLSGQGEIFSFSVRDNGVDVRAPEDETVEDRLLSAEVSNYSTLGGHEPAARERNLEERFDRAMQVLENPAYQDWLDDGDRLNLRDYLRTERQKAIADEGFRRDVLTRRMTEHVRSIDDGTPEGVGHILDVLGHYTYRTGSNYQTWYSLWDRYTRELEALSVEASAQASTQRDLFGEVAISDAIRTVMTTPGSLDTALAGLVNYLPHNELVTRLNPETNEEEQVIYAREGIISTADFRTVRNFLESIAGLPGVPTDPVATHAVNYLNALMEDSGIPEIYREPYLAEASARLVDTLMGEKWTQDAENKVIANPAYAELDHQKIELMVDAIMRDVQADRRRSEANRDYAGRPDELIDFEEIPDRPMRFAGIDVSALFGDRKTQDAAERLVEDAFEGTWAYGETTIGPEAAEMFRNLTTELTNRLHRLGYGALDTRIQPENNLPMWLIQTENGDHWVRFRYEKSSKSLVLQELPYYPNLNEWGSLDEWSDVAGPKDFSPGWTPR